MKKILKISKFLLIFFVIMSWIFSGFPQIFNPSTLFRTGFPPKIQKAQAAVAFDAAGTASSDLASYTVTVAANGPNPFLVVAVGIRESLTTVSTVSSNLSGALTFLRAEDVALTVRQEIWTLTAPATGTHVITITLVAAQQSVAIAITTTGANQTTPVTNNIGATGADTAPTATVTSAAGRLVIGFVHVKRQNTDVQIAAGAGQTQRATVSGPTLDRPRAEATDEAGAASVVTNWTLVTNTDWGVSAIDIDAAAANITFAQNAYRIYENKDAIQPDFSLGLENASSTVAQGEALRIRMGLTIGTANMASSTNQFKLQFNTASSTTGWTDVGKLASTTAIFRGYNNGSVANNATPTAVLLTSSLKRGTYQEEWPSDLGHEGANIGQDIEYDWVVFEQSATTSINYYFRMVKSDGTALGNYNRQAIVTVKARTYTQGNYQWFANQDSLTPGTNLNQINTGIGSVTSSDVRRLRIDISVGVIGLATSSKKFRLEYKTLGGGCGAAETWTAVGAIGSAEIWRGFNNPSVTDGATTTRVYLSSANLFETYEEENNTASSTTRIEIGRSGEYDWVIQDNSAALDTTYCFRMATTTGGAFDTYNNFPRLATANYQPTVFTGGSAAEAATAGVSQIPTTTPSGGAPTESAPAGVSQIPTTTPSGGSGESGYIFPNRFLAGIGSFAGGFVKDYWLMLLFFTTLLIVYLKNSLFRLY